MSQDGPAVKEEPQRYAFYGIWTRPEDSRRDRASVLSDEPQKRRETASEAFAGEKLCREIRTRGCYSRDYGRKFVLVIHKNSIYVSLQEVENMTIQEKIQIEAIKYPGDYKICQYELYMLITDGAYGVYLGEWMIDKSKYEIDEGLKELDPWEIEKKAVETKITKESISFGKDIVHAAVTAAGEKIWVWESHIKKFGKNKIYEIAKVEQGNIILVRDPEIGEIIGVITGVENMEIHKSEIFSW